jgi:large subunit ribosomal protein L18
MAHVKVNNPRQAARLRRKAHIRKNVRGSAERPRLSVFRSHKHIYAQAIDDDSNKILATASDQTLGGAGDGKSKKERAALVGEAIARKLLETKVARVVFDRNGYIYHGRVKEVAEGARKAGLQF